MDCNKAILEIIQFSYVYLLPRKHNTTSLFDVALTSLDSCDGNIVSSPQRLISMSLYETLQGRRFNNIVQRFHRNYMAALEQHRIATSQRRCNNVVVSYLNYENAPYPQTYQSQTGKRFFSLF